MYVYLYEWTYVCMQVCMYMCHVSTPISLYTFDVTEKYVCHMANMSHKAIMVDGCIDPIFWIIVPKHNQLQYLLYMSLPGMDE